MIILSVQNIEPTIHNDEPGKKWNYTATRGALYYPGLAVRKSQKAAISWLG